MGKFKVTLYDMSNDIYSIACKVKETNFTLEDYDASIRNKSIKIGALSVIAAFIQLTGYGSGFLRAWWKRCICGGKSFSAFEKTFYK